jgi:hypothetical protein
MFALRLWVERHDPRSGIAASGGEHRFKYLLAPRLKARWWRLGLSTPGLGGIPSGSPPPGKMTSGASGGTIGSRGVRSGGAGGIGSAGGIGTSLAFRVSAFMAFLALV